MLVIDHENIRLAFKIAWEESQPNVADAHEEGGFLLSVDDGSLSVERWPRGSQNSLRVPPYFDGRWNGQRIVATFHTHPNSGPRSLQEPSPTNVAAVRDDPHLQKAWYEGEYVISLALVYRILPTGNVETVGATPTLLGIAE